MSIDLEDSPSKVDSNLIENHGFGLWDFCLFLEGQFLRRFAEKSVFYQIYIIREEIDKLENLKKSLINRLKKHLKNLSVEINKDDLIKKYKLHPFFNEIDNEVNRLYSHPVFRWTNRSRVNFHNHITAVWTQVIKKDNNAPIKKWRDYLIDEISTIGIDWNVIADLIDWFKLRFKDTKYGVFFDYEKKIFPFVLRRQYYKYIKKNEEKKNLIIGDLSTLLTGKIYKDNLVSPPAWTKKGLEELPNKYPPFIIKISKSDIETIDIRKQKDKKKIYIIFPTGETLP